MRTKSFGNKPVKQQAVLCIRCSCYCPAHEDKVIMTSKSPDMEVNFMVSIMLNIPKHRRLKPAVRGLRLLCC